MNAKITTYPGPGVMDIRKNNIATMTNSTMNNLRDVGLLFCMLSNFIGCFNIEDLVEMYAELTINLLR